MWLCGAVLILSTPQVSAQSPPLPIFPNGVAYDAAGNLYFADTNRHQVYESSLAGVLTVVVGTGVQGFAGDGGAATSAQLSSPQGIAIGPDGTLYIADTGNQRIRAVYAGQITTIAGNGVGAFGGDNGPSGAALLNLPTALAVDASGALLLCDSGNQRVRRISNATIATIAGNGTQGFAGDGTPAVTAELDGPAGVAVGNDGRIYIADLRNNRIRVIAVDGTIGTFAGSGVRGYAGDGYAASGARLASPRGVMVTSLGDVVFADSNNQRLRRVDAKGIITTIAGSGVQGGSNDGEASAAVALDTPRGAAVSTFGSVVFADSSNHQVRESLADGNLYVPAGLAPLRTSAITLSADASGIYGQENAAVRVQGVAGLRGTAQLLDGSAIIAQTTLDAGAGSFPVGSLSSGVHALSAVYLGDGVNPAASSSAERVDIGAAIVTATANATGIDYGQAVPGLTGSITGVLPEDSGNVSALFTTTALLFSAPGTYPIGATLTGSASANYRVVLSSGSGSLTIDQAPSSTVESPLSQSSYAGLPLILTADVSSTTLGTPTGTVAFSDGATVVATVRLSSGVASATYLAPSTGTHSIVAVYTGDTDFLGSSSQAVTTTVGAMPDFSIAASGGATQTISAGGIATYTLTVTAQPAPFTGAVDMSVSGLPAGAVASFSPPQTIPGAGSAVVTMTVQTAAASARLGSLSGDGHGLVAWLLLPFLLVRRRWRTGGRALAVCALGVGLLGMAGCGARSISTAEIAQQRYTLLVTGTGTNLAGAVVNHTASVSLVIQ